jgi:hypothetical protein
MSEYKVPKVKPLSRLDINKKALRSLAILMPRALKSAIPINLVEIVEFELFKHTGFRFEIEELPENYEGYTDIINRKLVLSEITYENLLKNVPRARFTAAHELGHVFLHGDQPRLKRFNEQNSLKYNRTELLPYEDPEWQANEFAASLLIPTNLGIELIKKGAPESSFADYFQVSCECARIRYTNLKEVIKKNPSILYRELNF